LSYERWCPDSLRQPVPWLCSADGIMLGDTQEAVRHDSSCPARASSKASGPASHDDDLQRLLKVAVAVVRVAGQRWMRRFRRCGGHVSYPRGVSQRTSLLQAPLGRGRVSRGHR